MQEINLFIAIVSAAIYIPVTDTAGCVDSFFLRCCQLWVKLLFSDAHEGKRGRTSPYFILKFYYYFYLAIWFLSGLKISQVLTTILQGWIKTKIQANRQYLGGNNLFLVISAQKN